MLSKHPIYVFLILFTVLSASFKTNGQISLLNKKVKVKIMNGSLGAILDEIGKQGNFTFSYSNYKINPEQQVHLDKKKETVKYFLNYLFSDINDGMEYIERDNKIIIKPKKVIKKFITIRGKITDEETGLPVINSNINVAGTYIGTTSDNYGNYTLKLKVNEKGEKIIINYSHVSYENESAIIYTTKDFSFDVEMEMKITNLKEVSIFGMPRIAFGKKNFQIHDYEVTNDKLVLTVFENRQSKASLFMVNADEEFITSKRIPGTPIGTYKDCANDLHLITYYRPYKINLDSDKISINPTKPDAVNRLIKPCAAIGPSGKYYYYYYGPARLSVEYIVINPYDNKENTFRQIKDTLQLLLYKDNPDFVKTQYLETRGSMADIDIGDLREKVRYNKNKEEKTIHYNPIYAPLMIYEDQVLIFNHIQDKIEIYNSNGILIKNIPITYHKKEEWQNILYQDTKTQKVYTHFKYEWYSEITEIDLETGKLKAPFKITFRNIQKIQINNEYIYFLYSDIEKGMPSKCLYQQKLY